MKHTIILISAFVMLPCVYGQTVSRQVTASAGTSVSAASVQMDYTIGETVTLSMESAALRVNQGFNQPDFNKASVRIINADQYVAIYPNPTSGLINFEAKGLVSSVDITICDAAGKTVLIQQWHTSTPGSIDGSSWAAGVYTVCMKAGDQVLMYRLAKI